MLYGEAGGLEVGKDISKYCFCEIQDYAKDRFSKENCHVSVAGALTKEEVVSAVDKIIGKSSDKHLYNRNLLKVIPGVHARYIQDPGAGDYDVMLQFPLVEDDWPSTAFLQRFVAYTLGEGEISLLFGNARKQGLAYRLHSLLDHHCDLDVFAISFGTNAELGKVEGAIKMIKNELENARKHGIPPDDLRLFKQSFLFQLYNLSQSPDCIRSVASDEYLTGNKMLSIEKQIKLIKELTILDYKYLLRSLTKGGNKAIAVVGPADKIMAAKQMKKIVKLVKEIN
jgi:predicted Zn-dependent peptidase